MVGGIVEVGAPATQIFSAYLHVRGYVPEYVGYEILSVAVGTWQVVGITVFRVKAGHVKHSPAATAAAAKRFLSFIT